MSIVSRAMTRDGSARIICADTTEIVRRAREYHNTSKTMTAALGRALTATSLMGTLLKDEGDSLTLKFIGDGPGGMVICVSDFKGNVRGYAEHPEVELKPNSAGKLDVGGAIGKGSLYVVRDTGEGEPYVGISELVTGEIGDDITEYYAVSEQTPTVCALGVRVDQHINCIGAGGFLLQLMPGADEEVITQIEKNMEKIGSVSMLIADGATPDDVIALAFDGIEYDKFDQFAMGYICTCGRDKYLRAITSMPRGEIFSMLVDGDPIETQCRFCGKKYVFEKDEIIAALNP